MLFNVHAYTVVRVLICGIEAPTMEDAIKASDEVNLHPVLQRIFFSPEVHGDARKEVAHFEFTEDITTYLVDVQGESDNNKSIWFEGDGVTRITDGENRQEKALAVLEKIAAFKKWGEPNDDGEPFEPSDGVDDSHVCLMDLIDEARAIVGEQPKV